MNSRNYAKQFFNENGKLINQKDFLEELNKEFLSKITNENNQDSYEEAIKQIRMKWDNISNRIYGHLTNNLWKYFYKLYILKYRDEHFPELKKEVLEKFKKSDSYKIKQDKYLKTKIEKLRNTDDFKLIEFLITKETPFTKEEVLKLFNTKYFVDNYYTSKTKERLLNLCKKVTGDEYCRYEFFLESLYETIFIKREYKFAS